MCSAALSQYTFFYGLKLTTATFAITFANMAPVLTFLIAIALRYVRRPDQPNNSANHLLLSGHCTQ
jgi:drug/metabolite transporter (DMT)-like permease